MVFKKYEVWMSKRVDVLTILIALLLSVIRAYYNTCLQFL